MKRGLGPGAINTRQQQQSRLEHFQRNDDRELREAWAIVTRSSHTMDGSYAWQSYSWNDLKPCRDY